MNNLNPNNKLGGKTLIEWKAERLTLLGTRCEWEDRRTANHDGRINSAGIRSQAVSDECEREIAHVDRQIEVVERAISSLIAYGSRSLYPGGLPSNDGPVTAGGNQ